jgi:hypothetical protein
VAAFPDGDVDRLVELLAGDATFIGDGAGKGRGLPRPIYGRDRVVRLLGRFFSEGAEIGARKHPTVVNGQPGVLNFYREGRLINVLVLEIADGVIERLRSITNPEKLGHLGYPLSAVARARQPRRDQVESLAAIRHLEAQVLEFDGIALRYGSFYGPGTNLSAVGEITELVRKRRLPIIGNGAGVWSFLHVDDAASATIAAIDRGTSGVYNIADDHPTPVSEWLPELAQVLGVKSPPRIPAWLGRLAAGEVGVSMMTSIRGISNAKARRELGWTPRYASYREGFRNGFGGTLSEPLRGRDPHLISIEAGAGGSASDRSARRLLAGQPGLLAMPAPES